MGGKSRKSGAVSKKLIEKLIKDKKVGSCGSGKKKTDSGFGVKKDDE